MDKMEKTFGKGAVMRMGDDAIEKMEVIPSGSVGLDLALGVGATPRAVWWRSTGRKAVR
jgi:recombination protein RecA